MAKAIKQAGLLEAIHGCGSWQDIQAKWRTLPEKQKGDLFEELVTAYLQYRPFQQARAFAQELNLTGVSEWRAYCKGKMPHLGRLPADIPSTPDNTYADKGWVGFGDWLGTGRTRVSKSAKHKT
jgi:hypothetical protein